MVVELIGDWPYKSSELRQDFLPSFTLRFSSLESHVLTWFFPDYTHPFTVKIRPRRFSTCRGIFILPFSLILSPCAFVGTLHSRT